MKIYQKIQKIRELRGFSQDYLGKMLGISQQYYSKIESGKTEIDDILLIRIASVLEVDKKQLQAFDPNLFFNKNHLKVGQHRTIHNKMPDALLEQFVRMKDTLEEVVKIMKEQREQS